MSRTLSALARLRGCLRGATAVEFALLAPVFFGFLFVIIEGGRLLWTKQTLNEVAFSAVRCMSVSSTCASEEAIQTYAVGRAARYRIAVTSANVVPTAAASGVTCDGNANSNKVTISVPFNSPVRKLIPRMPTSVTSHACFAKLS